MKKNFSPLVMTFLTFIILWTLQACSPIHIPAFEVTCGGIESFSNECQGAKLYAQETLNLQRVKQNDTDSVFKLAILFQGLGITDSLSEHQQVYTEQTLALTAQFTLTNADGMLMHEPISLTKTKVTRTNKVVAIQAISQIDLNKKLLSYELTKLAALKLFAQDITKNNSNE